MRLYRFSPIETISQLLEAIEYVHSACYKLCWQSFGQYFANAGNIGIFCHYDKEYETLLDLSLKLTEPSDNFLQKYFRLRQSVIIPAKDTVPKTTYTHLYIRKPDPYRHHVGDIDFFLEPDEFSDLKQSMMAGKSIPGARLFDRTDLDMIELFDPDIDVLAYVSTHQMGQKVRVRQKGQ